MALARQPGGGRPDGRKLHPKRSHRLTAWTVPASRTRRGSAARRLPSMDRVPVRSASSRVRSRHRTSGRVTVLVAITVAGSSAGRGPARAPPVTRAWNTCSPRRTSWAASRPSARWGSAGQHHRVGAERGVTRRNGRGCPSDRAHHGPQVVAPWRQPVDARAGGRRAAWCARPPALLQLAQALNQRFGAHAREPGAKVAEALGPQQ